MVVVSWAMELEQQKWGQMEELLNGRSCRPWS